MRRQLVIDAAEALIRDTRSTSFSMLVLAQRAGVSPGTPYNLFGSKASILYALLNRSIDGISLKFGQTASMRNSVEVALAAVRAAVTFFVADPEYYRPLYQHLIGVSDGVHRPAFMERSFQYWRAALGAIREEGLLTSDHAQNAVARSLLIHFLGALDLWVQAELDHEQFATHILFGASALLLGVAPQESRNFLEQTMQGATARMPTIVNFHPLK